VHPEAEQQLARSELATKLLVWKMIADDLGGGDLVFCQGTGSPVERLLDERAGIDCLQVGGAPEPIVGIAMRVQPGYEYATFTIRFAVSSGWPTEYTKAKMALDARSRGALSPGWTVQAYTTEEGQHINRVGVVDTMQLITYVRRHEAEVMASERRGQRSTFWRLQQTHKGDARFIVVDWLALRIHRINVYEYDRRGRVDRRMGPEPRKPLPPGGQFPMDFGEE